MKLGFIGKFWFETHLKYLVTLMLSNLTLKKSKQTEKLKVITFFSVAHFGLLLPKTRLILAPIWPFLKNFWFRFRFLKDNSMMMINSTDFASNLQKNRKMWTISYLLRWRNNYRVLLLVYLEKNGFDFFMRLVKWPKIAVKKCQNLIFKVNFQCQKSSGSF